MKLIILIFGFVLTIVIKTNATTWFPSDHVCPVCKAKNIYQEIGSYGGYIYNWPSKYQYVYWPLTDGPSVYCCPDCLYSTFMWDFDSIPENKIDPVKKYLATVKLDKKYKDYLDIPMTTRLEIAENVYNILGQDDEFWCRFYRVLGYHYSAEKESNKALVVRTKALNRAKIMLNDTSRIDQQKETLFIIAAMYNFTNQKDSASLYLEKSGKLTYKNTHWKNENAEGLDNYLSNLIIQYKEFMKEGEEE